MRPARIVLSVVIASRGLLADSLDEQIAAMKKRVDAAQVKLEPKVTPLLVAEDYRFFVGQSVFSQVSAVINALPAATRVLPYQSTSTTGQLKNSNGGALGCGWYVELDSPTTLRASVAASAFGLLLAPSALKTSLHGDYYAEADVHAHVKAPGSPICWPPFDCKCPAGGGFGIHTPTRIPITGQDFAASASFESSPTSWLIAHAGLTAPDKLRFTFEVILRWPGGSLGVGVPTEQDIPKDQFLNQQFSGAFLSDGRVQVSTPVAIDKSYSIQISPSNVSVTSSGVDVRGGMTFVIH